MKLSLVLIGLLLAFVSIGEGLYIKNEREENDIQGSDPDKEEGGEPVNTLPADIDFGDIPLSNKRSESEDPTEGDSEKEEEVIWEDDGKEEEDQGPDYTPEEIEASAVDETDPSGGAGDPEDITEAPGDGDVVTEAYPNYEDGNGPEDAEIDWEDADTDVEDDEKTPEPEQKP